jgi:hypothetical protein
MNKYQINKIGEIFGIALFLLSLILFLSAFFPTISSFTKVLITTTKYLFFVAVLVYSTLIVADSWHNNLNKKTRIIFMFVQVFSLLLITDIFLKDILGTGFIDTFKAVFLGK